MPTYEYECLDCGYKFEKFQLMNDKPLKKCPRCPGRLKRLFGTGSGIIFKGPGFYATDYRKGKPPAQPPSRKTEPCKSPPCSKDEKSGKDEKGKSEKQK